MSQNELDVNEQEISSSESSSYSVSKSQKLAVAVLAFFAFITIVMWSFQFKKNLVISNHTGNNVDINQVLNVNSNEQTENDLRNKDTDGDGLNDWEELNTYKTSPYLEDSDSDGFGDKVEIESDNDPNCPVGRDCHSNVPVKTTGTNDDFSSFTNNIAEQELTQTGPKTKEINDLEKTLYVDGDVSELRQMLVDNGMDKALLDQISDTELLNLFKETLQGK